MTRTQETFTPLETSTAIQETQNRDILEQTRVQRQQVTVVIFAKPTGSAVRLDEYRRLGRGQSIRAVPPMEGSMVLLDPKSAGLPYHMAQARRVLLRQRDRIQRVVKACDSSLKGWAEHV